MINIFEYVSFFAYIFDSRIIGIITKVKTNRKRKRERYPAKIKFVENV